MRAIRGMLLVCLFVVPVAAKQDAKLIWLAVGSKELLAPVALLGEFRKSDGFDVRYAQPPVADAVKALGRAPAFLLIVGDYDRAGSAEPWQVAPMKRPFYKWRKPQREDFSTDALYGDTDGDLIPDFPVGRIPARTAKEVDVVVRKTLAFERHPPQMTDLRVLAWAGSPGYGGMIDSMATGMLVTTVRRFAPAWADRYLISSAPGNPLCGWPPDQPKAFNREWKRGSLISAFVAHASAQAVFGMKHGDKGVWYHIGHVRSDLDEGGPVSPAVFLTCSNGEFDGKVPCLAEVMLAAPGGPPVAIAATTESHPLTNLFTGRALLARLGKPGPRIGNIWLDAQREGAKLRDFLMETMLKDVEGKLEDEIDIGKLRRDQPLIFAILGDPALMLRVPYELEVAIEKTEKGWRYTVAKPWGFRLSVARRAAPAPAKPGAPAKDAEEANRLLAEANAKEQFTEIRSAGSKDDWIGEITEAGGYRFVRQDSYGLHTTVVELK